MNPIKKLAGETVIYGFSSIIGRALSYLLVPFYTRLFLPSDYGVITEFYAYAAFFNILYTYGMETAYFRFATKQGYDEKDSFNIATSAIITSSLLFSLLLIFFATPIVNLIGYANHERYVYYFVSILAIDAILAIPFAQLRLEKRALAFAKAKLFNISLNIFFNLFFLYFCASIADEKFLIGWKPLIARFYTPAWKIDYVFIANLMANALLLLLLRKPFMRLQFVLTWQRLRPMLRYTFPLILMGLAGTVNDMLSRATLKYLLPEGFYPGKTNETVLGIFGACYKLAIFMSLGVQAFRYAAEPLFFSKVKAQESSILFSQVMHGFITIGCFILFAISVNLDLVGYLFLGKPAYREGIEIVPYLLLAYLLLGVYYNLSVWFKITERTYYGTYITSIGALVTIGMNVWLIPLLGYWGSVWAVVASYLTMSILCYYFGQKYYPIPYQVSRGLAYIIGTIGLVYLIRCIPLVCFPLAVVAHLVFTLLFALLLYRVEQKKGAS